MSQKDITINRKARHLYHILEVYEAGIVLKGTEVKSCRQAKASIQEAYARVDAGEVWLIDSHISPYESSGYSKHDPKRKRKLLLKKSEIRKLIGATQQKGLTLIPLKMYFKKGIAKVELGLAKGKKIYDRREDIAKREAQREAEAAQRRHQKTG